MIRNLKKALLFMILIIVSGVAGFMIIEKWSFVDSLYMTVITLSTVGYSEVAPITPAGKIFVIILISSGIGTAAYFVSLMTRFILDGEFQELFRRKKMEGLLKNINEHYIVCGSGKVAHEAVKEMRKKGKSIIFIDEKSDSNEEISTEKGVIKIKGDPTEDIVLERAKIRKAKALLVTTDNDANNLYITLTARQVNQNLYIVALADKESSMEKFRKAGANRVISITGIGAKRLASSILRPTVVDFLEVAMYGEDFQLQMEEVLVEEGSFLENKMLKESEIRTRSGVIVLAIRRDHKLDINPEPDYVIKKFDKLITLGSLEQLKKMFTLARNSEKSNQAPSS